MNTTREEALFALRLAPDATFSPIDFPGARTTATRGVNPRGDIVGFFVGSDGHTQAPIAGTEDDAQRGHDTEGRDAESDD